MRKTSVLFVILMVALVLPGSADAQQAPFNRGVNLTGWFQTGSVSQIQFNRYSKKDFENIKSLGCDVIRLPINLHFMTKGQPDYRIEPLFYEFLDQVVSWAEELNLYLILDNHTFDPAVNTNPNVGPILEKVWLQMATHYKERSQYIMYEILNEPHGISDAAWNAIQLAVIDKIRTVDTRHTLVVGPSSWNTYNNLAYLPRYQDTNLLYTFHFYDPFLFTHQGATWVDPSMAPLSGIPFPYQADSMPALPASLTSTWVGDNYRSYAIDGTVQKVKQLIDIAVRFRDDRKVPIFCGEFGVYIPNSKNHHRVFWYEVVRKYLEEKQIAWTSWDYHGGFGLFESGSNGFFEHDLNVQLLKALGLIVPDQTDYTLLPDSTGSFIYSDYPGEQMFESSYNDGIVNYYSEDLPNNGRYCLKWSGAKQYNTIGLDYQPDRDFSFLANNNYALDLMVRGDTPGLSFQIRFIDTKTQSATDYPWRMGIKIDETKASWDRRWHHLYLPLSSFSDLGSWYNGWHNPAGLFDWKAVDRIEIVTEYGQLGSGIFWFDNIHLTNRDTAKINQTGVFSGIGEDFARTGTLNFTCYPNPVYGFLTVDSPSEDALSIELIDIQGKTVLTSQFRKHTRWDVSRLNAGLYFVRITDNQRNFITRRICKIDG